MSVTTVMHYGGELLPEQRKVAMEVVYEKVMAALLNDGSCFVILEPGDRTSYKILLSFVGNDTIVSMPFMGITFACGSPPFLDPGYVLGKIGMTCGGGPGQVNPYTLAVLCQFCNELSARLEGSSMKWELYDWEKAMYLGCVESLIKTGG